MWGREELDPIACMDLPAAGSFKAQTLATALNPAI